MKTNRNIIFPLLIIMLTGLGAGHAGASLPGWALGPFQRPVDTPVISPDPASLFMCPMREETVGWEESDTFNPAAVAKDGRIVVIYRAEDNSGQGIGKRTSRLGYAESSDGVVMERRETPVMYPDTDGFRELEWPGGCEDPRIAMTEDGLYVMFYTAWNRKVARLAVATSTDLVNWEKHGLAFGKAYGGRFEGLFCKSASILTTIKDGRIVIEKTGGKYFMYWGERAVHAATSDDLVNWEPVLDEQGELKALARPRSGYFDSDLTECGPPALLTADGIVLIYNGRNASHGGKGDPNYPSGAYCAGQMLFDAEDPCRLLDRLDIPFFRPEAAFEKSGQYVDGTVFAEGLAYLNDKLYLYYGCADSYTGVAVCDYTPGSYDVVIVGGTPAGITAAIAAAREGKNCVILERSEHIGGLPVNGLGATDIATRGATTGLFSRFVAMNREHYVQKYGGGSQQVRDCSDGYHFEPSVAARTFDRMLEQAGPGRITVLTLRQFDSEPRYITKDGERIVSIRILDRRTGAEEHYAGKMFIDATYEGDLGAAAGVPYKLGREGLSEYGEPCSGQLYRWWKHGPDDEGTTYRGDNAIQAYNYRLCLTNDPDNRMDIPKPDNYNREEFVSLIDDVLDGRNTDVRFRGATPEQMAENRIRVLAGGRTSSPGDPWGMAKLTSMTRLPNGKTDANNQHLALISTDLPEENWPWPTSGWEWRDRYAQRLRDYTLGLLWFAQNDEDLPLNFRRECRQWGLASDEYPDNEGFPRQVYVREGRRLEGVYFFTANDALPLAEGARPPLHGSSVTASHYALDSHAVRKREEGRVHLDGFFSHPTAVYTVPYGVMVPQQVDNLLFPVAVSGSHVGFSTLRMEPCWMALGEAAGTAAAIAMDSGENVRDVSTGILQQKLLSNGATLVYLRDVKPDDPDFASVQRLALLGFFPEWDARLDDILDENTARMWSGLSGTKLKGAGKITRREAVRSLASAMGLHNSR